MPTISQLPAVAEVTPADSIPVSQSGATHSVSVGALLASMQPAIIADPGTLLGRVSLGAGGPEPIAVGPGLLLNSGTLIAAPFDFAALPQQPVLSVSGQVLLNNNGTISLMPVLSLRSLFTAGTNIVIDTEGTISSNASDGGSSLSYSITGLPAVTAIASSDLVAISQAGTDHAISYANLLDGLTIDQAQPAVPASDADTLWVAQGNSTMLRQSFAAIWAWLTSKLSSYKLPVVEVIANATLDGTIHNGRVLVCSQAVTLTPAPLNMGSGFRCDVLNLSGGNVTFAAGITTSTGSSSLPSGQAATLTVATYSGGTIVFASLAGTSDGSGPALPGQVGGLATSNPTTSSVTLSWSVPGSGGTVSSYTVQYRVTGNPTWSIFASGVTATTATVSGLTATTGYDFRIYAVNSGGSGTPSASVSASTISPPGNVTALTWLLVPVGPYTHGSGTIGVNAQVTPSSAAVKFGFSTSATVPPATWVNATHVNTNLWAAYVSTPAVAGAWYGWVEGTDGSLPTVYATPFTVT